MSDGQRDETPEMAELLARVARSADRAEVGPDALWRVRRELAARQRARRRGRFALGVVAAVVLLGLGVGLGVVLDRSGDDEPEVASDRGDGGGEEEESTGAPRANIDGVYRPAGFFADLAGGSASPISTDYRVVDGNIIVARLAWTPDGSDTESLVGLAVERFARDPGAVCAGLLDGAARCVEQPSGGVLADYELPAQQVDLSPVHQAESLTGADEGALVRGVTYLRPDGLAVTAVLCGCATDGSALPGSLPEVSLEQIVQDDSWVIDPADRTSP